MSPAADRTERPEPPRPVATRLVPAAKIATPELPPDFVARPRLRAELDAAAEVTLVCAPAGHGKTTLIVDSARTSNGIATAWVGLDRDDNDPWRLWSSVMAAISGCRPTHAPELRISPAAERSDLLTDLLHTLAGLPAPVRLVLDDVHLIDRPSTWHELETFVRHAPPTVRLVLSSRFDPPIGLHRLRLAGRLCELRADRIRFSRDETATMLEKAGVWLTDAQLHAIHERTGGWIAGLRLATLALTGRSDQAEALADFSGDNRAVGDYLVDEVLATMPAATLEVLRLTSISDPVPVGLAAELSGRVDAGVVLDRCERETGLIQRIRGTAGSYRVQPLLRGYLLAELHRHLGRRQAARLHATAARWWIAEGVAAAALRHATDARDAAVLTDVLRRVGARLLVTGESAVLRHGLETLGAPAAADPWLSSLSALANLQAGERADASDDLRRAGRDWPADPSTALITLRTSAGQLLGLAAPAPTPGGQVSPDGVPPEDPALHALARFASGHAALHEDLDRSTARRELESALRTARQEGFEYLILQCLDALAALAEAEGDIRRMHRAIAEVLGSATERGWQRSAPYVGAATRLAFAELVRAEPTQAARRAAQLLARGDGELEPVQRYALHVVHGAAVADLGESATGLTELRQARTEHGAGPADRKLLAAAASFEFGSAITLGHQASARAAQDWLAQRVGDTAELRLMRSRVASTAGRHADARAEIGPVLDGSSEALLATTPIEAWLQEAQIASRAGERLSARHALTAALQLAEPLDALRPFAQAHPAILRLLAVYHADADISTFAGRALAVERRVASPAYAELSARELTVLSLLPSLLTMDEIADELTVSVNTIKSHVRSIYGKLNVPNRRTAVLAAHAQGLLRRRAD